MLPEGSHTLLPDLNQHRIRPSKNEPDAYSTPSTSRRVTFEGLEAPVADEEVAARGVAHHPAPHMSARAQDDMYVK